MTLHIALVKKLVNQANSVTFPDGLVQQKLEGDKGEEVDQGEYLGGDEPEDGSIYTPSHNLKGLRGCSGPGVNFGLIESFKHQYSPRSRTRGRLFQM